MNIKRLYVVLILFTLVISSDEGLVVTGTDEPVYGRAGEDVTLSCSVDTHVNVTKLQVEWRKTDDDILVLLYADGENRLEAQDGRYSGRAEFFSEEIPKGNFSMKLSEVRLEDKGKFMCKVSTDTYSANATARIHTLGFSSLHWFILVLSIAVTPVVLITGAFSVRNLESGSREALWCHCLHVTVPSIMVSLAFILWGLTEGSPGEAVTCTVVSLLNILVLFSIAPYRQLFTATWREIMSFTRTANPIIMMGVVTGSVIENSAKYSQNAPEKTIFGGILSGIIFIFIFLTVFRIAAIVIWIKFSSESAEKRLVIFTKVAGITGIIFLLIMASSIIAVSVFMAKYFSEIAWKEQLGTFLNLLMVPITLVLFPVGFSVFWIIRSLRTTGKVRLRDILRIWGNFMFNPVLFNLLFLTIYNQLFAWMQNTLILRYSFPIAVATLGISLGVFIWDYMKCFSLASEGFYYLGHKILVGIFFILHLILSSQYLNLILENDKGRPVKMCEYLFVYILTITSCFRDLRRRCLLVKPRKYVYLSGAFGLPVVNSVGLAAELILKSDTGKQTLDLRPVVLISESLTLFCWIVILMSAYCIMKRQKIRGTFTFLQRPQDPDPDQIGAQDTSAPQGSHDNQEMDVLSPADPCGPNTEEGSHDNQETEASSPTDPNGPNTEQGSHDIPKTEVLSPADPNGLNTDQFTGSMEQN